MQNLLIRKIGFRFSVLKLSRSSILLIAKFPFNRLPLSCPNSMYANVPLNNCLSLSRSCGKYGREVHLMKLQLI